MKPNGLCKLVSENHLNYCQVAAFFTNLHPELLRHLQKQIISSRKKKRWFGSARLGGQYSSASLTSLYLTIDGHKM